MKIIGIDQSYSCTGICIIEDGELLHFEVIKSPKAMDKFERSNLIAGLLLTTAVFHNVDLVAIEGLAFGMRGDATRDLAGLQYAIVNKLRFEGGFNVEIIAPNAVKKFATGDGRAKKEELYEALPEYTQDVFKGIGVKKTTGLYDLTDAYWIAMAIEEKEKQK